MSTTANKVNNLDAYIWQYVIDNARQALTDISRYEIYELAERDPSFAEVAKVAKELVVKLASVAEQGGELRSIDRVKEYAGILESVSLAIKEHDNRLLSDCISHLQEFTEINSVT